MSYKENLQQNNTQIRGLIDKVNELPNASSVQSDWNQNDSTAKDYIKNRTHYIEYTPVITNEILHFEEGEDDIAIPINMEDVSSEYLVTYNGIEYECPVSWPETAAVSLPSLGNLYLISTYNSMSDHPFAIMISLAYQCLYIFRANTREGYPACDIPFSFVGVHRELIPAHFLPNSNIVNGVGKKSTVEGDNCQANGDDSHAEGAMTQANAPASHSEGLLTITEGYQSHAEGNGSTARGDASHAEGFYAVTEGMNSHAEGGYTYAAGPSSHAEGVATMANGENSHAEGSGTAANALNSHSEGANTIASSDCQHVQGMYNIEDANNRYAHIVGNGNFEVTSNAHTLDWSGNAVFAGSVSGSGADYAEHFEWLDGNPDKEDRIGTIVTLEGDKIRNANVGDDILGIISGTAMVIGDNAEWEWQGKFLTDNYGRIIYETVENFIEIKIPHTNEIQKKSLGMRPVRKLNPEWDETLEYQRRSERPEWDVVGLFGKLYVNDDGTCVVGGYATNGDNGVATASSTKTNMRVMKRITNNIVLVFMK